MLKVLEKANKSLGVTKKVKSSKAKLKARDLAKEWDKISVKTRYNHTQSSYLKCKNSVVDTSL